MPRRLRLVPLGPPAPPPPLLTQLAAALRDRLELEVVEAPLLPVEPRWWHLAGRQLSSNLVVDALGDADPADGGDGGGEWVVAVTAADLVAEGREFVFGEATLGGFWAVVSTARLSGAGPELSLERLSKEVAHEIGHLRGLDHCSDPGCVMARSADVDAIDRKSVELCGRCRPGPPASRDP